MPEGSIRAAGQTLQLPIVPDEFGKDFICYRCWQRGSVKYPMTIPCSSEMRIVFHLLAIVCFVVAVMYYVRPGGALPTFMPGYNLGSTHIHTMHAVAAATAAIIFFLIGLSARR